MPYTIACLALFICILATPVAAQEKSSGGAFDTIPTQRLLERSREAYSADDYVLAAELYKEILIREPNNIEAIIELANVYERDGKLEYAQGLLFRAERLVPNNTSVRERRASVEGLLIAVLTEEVESLIFRAQYDLAIPKLGLHLSLEPKNDKLHYQRATCFLKKGQLRAALSDAQRAIVLSPKEEYYTLRRQIVEETRRLELASHIERAKPLTTSARPEDQQEIRVLLTEILQLDPQNEWAKAELSRLATNDEAWTGAAMSESPDSMAATTETGDSDPFLERARREAKKRASMTAMVAHTRNIAEEFREAAAGLLSPSIIWAMVILVVAWLFLRSPIAKSIAQMFAHKPLLSGHLKEFHINEVLLLISAEPRTGILRIKGKRGEGKLFFSNGEPCHCVAGKLEGIVALTLLLDNPNDGYFSFRVTSIPLNNTIDIPLGLILAERSRNRANAANDTTVDDDAPKKSRMKELLDSRS